MAIIGISGKIGSGKSTIGKIIQYLIATTECVNDSKDWEENYEKEHNFKLNSKESLNHFIETFDDDVLSNWKIKAFAGKLKQIVSILTGISVEDLEKQEVKNRVLGKEWWYYELEYKNNLMEKWVRPINKRFITENEVKQEASKEPLMSNCCKAVLIKPTVRQLLQIIGTDLLRDMLHPNVHINALFSDYKDKDYKGIGNGEYHDPNYPNWIITDMRFPNEMKAVQDRNGITIRVNRPFIEQVANDVNKNLQKEFNTNDTLITSEHLDKETIKDLESYKNKNEHESETALDSADFDYVVENNKDIEHLIKEVKEILIVEGII